MYKYFHELENQKAFKTYLIRKSFDKEQDLSMKNIFFSDSLLKKLSELFPKINIVDKLIIALNEELITNTPTYNLLPYDAWFNMECFFNDKDEYYLESNHYLREKIDLTSWNLQYILEKLSEMISYLINFYPNYKEFLLNTQKEIKIILNEFSIKSTIKIPPKSDGETVNWPNAWYITPNGYLYNTGLGHQTGNLIYSFYYVICDFLKHNKNIPNINYYSKINNILKRGYITYGEFQNYSHLAYNLPTIITPEVEHDIVRYKNILKMNDKEYNKAKNDSEFKWPEPERSYQKNLITLIIGHLAAETSLYSSFIKLNESLYKNKLIAQLNTLAMNDLKDILIRFSGFHKIESTVDNTITTCSLNGITEFSEYLEKGWNLHIIPGIIYDKNLDKLVEVDFNEYFISKHLDNEIENYEGKGKLLIKDKWIN